MSSLRFGHVAVLAALAGCSTHSSEPNRGEPDGSDPPAETPDGEPTDPDGAPPPLDDAGPNPSKPDADAPDADAPDAAAPPAKGNVYADALAAGWNLNGWGWASDASEPNAPARGLRSIGIQMTRAGCGFVLAHVQGGIPQPFAPGSHAALEFSLHTGTTPERIETLEVRLNNGSGKVRVRDWIEGPIQADQWVHVRIPFDALNASLGSYYRIEWINASDASFAFTIDEVELTPGQAQPEPAWLGSLGVARFLSAGQSGERFSWIDAKGRPRSADFVDDSSRGGYISSIRYETAPGVVREAHGGVDPSTGYQGFGYLVSHYETGANGGASSAESRDGNYSATLRNNGHSTLVWHGKHHAIRQYEVDLHPGLYQAAGYGVVRATVHWLVASGRSSLLFSVTFDSSANAPDRVVADSRAPYGALAWDGRGGTEAVSGVAWGDKRRFVADTGAGKLNIQSGWTYTAANVVPFNMLWTANSDAEMGLIDTRSWARSVSAGDLGVWFDNLGRVRGSQRIDLRCWNRTSDTATNCADPSSDGVGAKMPVTWTWPFQSVNYGLGAQGTTAKKIAWGTNYGAIGHRSVVSFGERTYSGYPYTSYATQVVLGTHSEQATFAAVAAQEAALATQVTAQVGSVRSSGASGVDRNDDTPFEVPGFDPVYGAFAVLADANGQSDFTLASGSGTLAHPLVVIDGAAAEPTSVQLDGATLTADVDYYASVQGTRVWITLNRDLSGSHVVSVRTR